MTDNKIPQIIEWHGSKVVTCGETAQDLDNRIIDAIMVLMKYGWKVNAISVDGLPSFEIAVPWGMLKVN